MKTELTTEQSQHLIDLGVPKEKASEIGYELSGKSLGGVELPPVEVPVFTLPDLLEILPNTIDKKTAHRAIQSYDGYHYAFYCYAYGRIGNLNTAKELIDSLYQLACWYYGEYLKK